MRGIACTFRGRVGRDAELTYTRAGTALLTFSVAVEESEQGQAGPTTWVRVAARGALAESLKGRLAHGVEVAVEGRLTLSTRTGRGDAHRCGFDVSAQTVRPTRPAGARAARTGPAPDEWRRPLPSRPDAPGTSATSAGPRGETG